MLQTVLLWAATISFVLALYAGASVMIGWRRLQQLKAAPARHSAALPPLVSIIIAARNEERDIEAALSSLLAQDYPGLEFIVIDDRSTDQTGAILDRMTRADKRLHVVHRTELPAGWLGKTYALYTGAKRAHGSILLFTDADVCMQPSTVARAVNFMESRAVDHLTVLPQLTPRSRWLKALIACFTIVFMLYARPWKARDHRSSAHVGVGAFNMVRRKAYETAGTHHAIAMRPDDDLKLGKMLKKAGFRADVLVGEDLVWLEWYPSWTAMREGLMKNAFAGLEYSFTVLVLLSVLVLGVFVMPFVALALTQGIALYVNIATVVFLCLLYAGTVRAVGLRYWYGPLLPAVMLVFLYICWRAALLVLVNDGIDWRGTHYPLASLRANKV
ncbi:MAG: glycosyltransferase [Acidiferrobacterales bacterium]